MPVPDKLVFGPRLNNNSPVTYGEIRRIKDRKLQIKYLKRRIDQFFIYQTSPLYKNENNEVNVKSVFPLALLTCVGVETLGQIVINENKDASSYQFTQILNLFDKRFSRTLPKKMKQRLLNSLGDYDKTKVKTISDLIHSYFRNTMVHGYRGRWVFLSVELKDNWTFDESTGFIVIQPIWFWETFLKIYEDIFNELLKGKNENHKYFKSCEKYIDKLLFN